MRLSVLCNLTAIRMLSGLVHLGLERIPRQSPAGPIDVLQAKPVHSLSCLRW